MGKLRYFAIGTVWSALLVLALAAPLFPSLAAAAGGSEAKLTVSATIRQYAYLRVIAQPTSVVVTAADLRRGYVDANAPMRVAVKSNSAGYMLIFAGHGEFVRQIRVRGLDNEVQMGPSGGAISQSGYLRGITDSALDLSFRFELSAGAEEGVYPWPMQLSVVPL